jgi:amino acid adenylation domain-containing protein
VVLVTMHHIVSDGWSMEILRREVEALYGAFSQGLPSPLPELPVQYADYAVWQRSWLRGEVLQTYLDSWRQRLAGTPTLLELPTDFPRPPVRSWLGEELSMPLPPQLVASLARLGRNRQATLFMTLMAVFQALLTRATGQTDFCVGAVSAGRGRLELEGLIGFFVNTLVIRADVGGDPQLIEILERVRETMLEAETYEDLPFDRLVEELRVERSLAYTPLVQVLFGVEMAGRGSAAARGDAGEPRRAGVALGTGTAKFDLSLTVASGPEGASVALEYSVDLFERTTMLRLLGHWTRLLEASAAGPERRVSELSWLGEAERHQLVREWNDTETCRRGEACSIHDLVAAQAGQVPDAVAAVIGAEGTCLTYGELGQRSRCLAARLAAMGAGRGCFVAILMESSLDLVVALLGVLEAGAAFVPLDPRWPEGRSAAVLDSLATLGGPEIVLVASAEPAAVMPPWVAVPVGAPDLQDEASRAPAVPSAPGDPIYAIYTSGSTGRPKGVVVQHEGIANRFLWMDRFFGSAAAVSVLQTTQPIYDSAVWQILWPLTHGGTTVLTSARQMANPSELAALIAGHGITLADFVPALFELFVERMATGERPAVASLRAVVVGGEEMDPAVALAFSALVPGVKLVNLYGPTEASIGCIAYVVESERGGRVPIGRPISNTRARILDRRGMPLPMGVPGELCLGGRCLGIGYLGDGEATGRAFVPEPFATLAGERLYRTGDLARWLPDGRIDFLGRLDHQVKLRGLRIELGEIEAALAEHADLRAAVVVARKDGQGVLRLVAYVVPVTGAAVVARELRSFLGRSLPDYMVPSAFVLLDELPLTPNGKLDRQALPEPADRPQGRIAPRDETELRVARIWEEVLGIGPIGVNERFFDLGGHSLLAVRLMARLRSEFGRDLPISALFQHPTVESLAPALRERSAQAVSSSILVPVRPAAGRAPFFCVHPVGGTVLCYEELARRLSPVRPFFGLQAAGLGAGPSPMQVEEMAGSYLEALRQTAAEGPLLLGGWSMGALVALEMARLSTREGRKPDLLALIDPATPAKRRRKEPAESEAELVHQFAHDLAGLHGDLDLSGNLAGEREPLRQVFEQVRAANLIPLDFTFADARAHFDIFRRNQRALAAYSPGVYEGRVALLLAAGTPLTAANIAAWRRIAAGGLEVHTFPGDHYSLLRSPDVERLAATLGELLEQAEIRFQESNTRKEKE